MIKICLFDHHDYVIPTDGIGGVIGLFQILYDELLKFSDVELTIIVNDKTTLKSKEKFKVIRLDFEEIENIRFGRSKIIKYFNGDIFYSNSSGRHVNFDFDGFNGKWIATCHGCDEWVGNTDCQVFVSNNQLLQHLRDGLFETYSNNYRVVHGVVDTKRLYYEEGTHDRIVWMGRIDGDKAKRLYEIARNTNEKILAAGWYSDEWEWLFQKIINTGNVEWIGRVDGDAAKRLFYSKAKVSIHCSTFEDPCPITIIESQACGIPVISYANGSMKEICYYKELIFSNLEDFVIKLNSNSFSNYNPKDLINFIYENFRKELYGFNFYKIMKETKDSNMNIIDQKFEYFKEFESDINEHFDTLKKYALECESIVEMGVRDIKSTWAFLSARPKKLRSYDFTHPSFFGANVDEVVQSCCSENIDYEFILSNTLECNIEVCDLLFIDTWHDYLQLKSELFRHNKNVKKYIILHDTNSFAFENERLYDDYENERSETNLPKGLNSAIDEFLYSNRDWFIYEKFAHNNGLTILKRI
jgi:glycosyltransferase involved in cell wall biosynthesis